MEWWKIGWEWATGPKSVDLVDTVNGTRLRRTDQELNFVRSICVLLFIPSILITPATYYFFRLTHRTSFISCFTRVADLTMRTLYVLLYDIDTGRFHET
jgi:hypothetical protein